MLSRLSIRNIVLIDRLDIDFAAGMSALTGETGAGKSILLDAMSLALGGRGDGSLVRTGEPQGQVTAVFDLAKVHPVHALLREAGIAGEGETILRRVQGADGRSKAFINDQPVSVSLLRQAGQLLVEIHGQHDDRAMVEAQTHRRLLDAFGELEGERRLVNAAWAELQAAREELAALRVRVVASEREADYLRASVEELRLLAPEPGEELRLADTRGRMMKVEKIATDINDAHEQLSGQASPVPTLSSLLRRLERKTGEAPGLLDDTIQALDAAMNGLLSAQQSLEAAIRETEFDPLELERSEERLFALRAAARKFSVTVDDLPDLAVRMADELATLDAGEEHMAALSRSENELAQAYDDLAGQLSSARRSAGAALVSAVASELPSLKLEHGEFIVRQVSEISQAGPNGIDAVEFHVRTNPGSEAGPMMKIASGGELARFLLALKVSLTDKGSAPTLVFDEIDSGVGGAVADAIGRRLGRLAGNVQVLSVTHAPQVAARAAQHFVVFKQEAGSDGETARMETGIAQLEGMERREEIARMLAGATITDEARAAAERLIGQAVA